MSQGLRLRLVAAQGRLADSLSELEQDLAVADAGSLTVVLSTLRETLSRTHLAADAQARLAQYALGFGQAPPDADNLPSDARTVLDALRAYETGAPVDLASLELEGAEHSELSAFIQLAKARAEVRHFDDELRGLQR